MSVAVGEHDEVVLPGSNWNSVLALGCRWGLRLQVFLLLKVNCSAVFLVTAVIAVLFNQKIIGDLSLSSLIINLNAYLSVITSAVYADALAVATSELVGMAGTQLEFYAEIQDQN